MQSTVINDSYYVGFERDPEIIFMYEDSNERYELKLWNGYFATLLDCMLEQVRVPSGILHEYVAYEGWYEESPWEITNLEEAIQLFKSFDINKVTEHGSQASTNIISMLPVLTRDILTWLEQAKARGSRVFIIYN